MTTAAAEPPIQPTPELTREQMFSMDCYIRMTHGAEGMMQLDAIILDANISAIEKLQKIAALTQNSTT